jgi:AraC-like DNA-binding protein
VRDISEDSFSHLLQTARATYARELLRGGRNTIMGAAFSSGFNDLSNFYRVYRRVFGRPPGKDLGA